MSERVTIKSIAKDLGISHMTVSRALSNHPNVMKATRDAVKQRARELGYVKNAAASAMRGDETQIIGLLLPNIVNEFYAQFANTMALACEAKSLQLVIHLTGDNIANEEKALERLHQIQVQRVVMVPTPGKSEKSVLHLRDTSVIQLIRQRDIGRPTPTILVDDSPAIRDAVAHLAAQGHQRIAYIGADKELTSGRSRLAAFREGLKRTELTEIPELICTGGPSKEMGQTHARRILNEKRATAMVCGGFEISNGALGALMETGLQPSENLSFIGYGDPSFYTWVGRGISTVAVPVEPLAYKAVDLLTGRADPASDHIHRFVASLIVR
ncbi:LacI family DNA-binding transcriptional regulator [Pelagimonas varians]|uniref:Putative HTH-type transcriptional repressor ExuR n=1 Tax=Pelagimonas varians TaxID=696760 RepID=A0A238L2Q1_9RHOB|nr:LacI family DNA-binding transcriptional regulator [Pelagimonas varians]PYG27213.1 LacI family transcriptional regulator [Pelagimonas varians]SMX48712.1 putative HTH-type transcriptional repressor ExuR [Pelagimonas varians]